MEKELKEMRKTMLKTSAIGKDGNLQSCFSSLEIIWTLYTYFMPSSQEEWASKDRNRFVLSKGQSNLALMTVLAKRGFISNDELSTFCQFDSRISMQADRTKFDPFVETSAGSLGHGLPMAVGLAWGKRIKNEYGRIFCLAGDGEMNEGTMWEALMFAASEKLNNIVLIIDNNHSIQKMIDIGDFTQKIVSFGWDCCSVDGHNINELKEALCKQTSKPLAILATTIRGWGSKTLMDDRSWFHRYPKQNELNSLLAEVDEF